MRVSSPTEFRQGMFAAALSLPLTLVAVGVTLAFAGFVV